MTTFQSLSNDLLFSLAIQLDLSDLLKFCSASKRINNTICKKDNIWLYKLNKEFPDWRELKSDINIKNPITLFPIVKAQSVRDIYIILYHWNIFKILKEKIIKEDLYKIYQFEELHLDCKQIIEIPREIGQLINLQILSLNNNHIIKIPKEIGQLKALKKLYLNNNNIIEIPKEIEKLTALKELFLNNNKITDIPIELTQLTALYLRNNKITEIPKEIEHLTNLQGLY